MGSYRKYDFGEEIVKMLPRLMRAVTRQDESIFTSSNITISQMLVLEFLHETGSCPMSGIARVLNLTMSASTSIVDKMVKGGLIERKRSEEDRRVVKVSLTSKGEKLAGDMRASKVCMIDNIYSVLTSSEKEQYLKLIRKVYENLED